MNRVTQFEIYTDNPETVQPFYREVFGWNFQKFEGGPVECWLMEKIAFQRWRSPELVGAPTPKIRPATFLESSSRIRMQSE